MQRPKSKIFSIKIAKDHKTLASEFGDAALVAERLRYQLLTTDERQDLELMLRNAAKLAWHHASKYMADEKLRAMRAARSMTFAELAGHYERKYMADEKKECSK